MDAAAEPTVIVAGAGYSGSRLAARLRASGRRVITLTRRPLDDPGHIVWDADAGESPALPAEACQLVFLIPPAAGEPEPRLAALLRSLPTAPDRVVLTSTSGVYGDCGGALVTETRPVAPATERARRRVAQEQTLADWGQSHHVRTVILRVAGIYGPGRLPTARLDAAEPVIAAGEAFPGNRIHVDDLVAAMLAALTHPAADGVYNVADGNHASGTEFYRRVAALTGRPAPREVSRADARASFTPQRYSFLAESRRLSVQRLTDDLGVQLMYTSLDDGIRASLAAEA